MLSVAQLGALVFVVYLATYWIMCNWTTRFDLHAKRTWWFWAAVVAAPLTLPALLCAGHGWLLRYCMPPALASRLDSFAAYLLLGVAGAALGLLAGGGIHHLYVRLAVPDPTVALELAAPHDELAVTRRLAPKYKAQAEVRLPDGSRADLVSEKMAYEVDWAQPGSHWEAIGQALYYGLVTEKEPGVILLVTDASQERYVARTRRVCDAYGITLHVEHVR